MKMAAVEFHQSERGYWIGLDVAKATFDAALICPGQHYPATPLSALPAATFERSERGTAEFLAWMGMQLKQVPQPRVRAVMEATGKYSTHLAMWISAQCPMLAPAIVNPHLTSVFIQSLGLRNATDRLSARALALYGAERSPQAYTSAPPEYLEMQALHRYRDVLVRERVAEKNRAEIRSISALVNTIHRSRLQQWDRSIQRIEKKMKDLVDSHPSLARDVALLCSIYGVAFLSATLILAELGNLRRFERARQLTSFAGLNPRKVESGTSVHKPPRMSKQGNARVRQALYLCAMAAVRGDNDFHYMYRRLIEDGKTAKAALGAIMRKLLVLMRAILLNGKPYDPLWKTGVKNSGDIAQTT
jgi:transposase